MGSSKPEHSLLQRQRRTGSFHKRLTKNALVETWDIFKSLVHSVFGSDFLNLTITTALAMIAKYHRGVTSAA